MNVIVYRGDWCGVRVELANRSEMAKRSRVGAQRVRDVLRSWTLRQNGRFACLFAFRTMIGVIQSLSCRSRIEFQFTPVPGNLQRLVGVS